jgi:putative addiction module component (TIGR02574 family)
MRLRQQIIAQLRGLYNGVPGVRKHRGQCGGPLIADVAVTESPLVRSADMIVRERRRTMADLVSELADRGRSLAPEDRSRLVELLLESLHEPPLSEIEAAWDAEIVRRVAAYERGEVETFAAEHVFAQARRIAP